VQRSGAKLAWLGRVAVGQLGRLAALFLLLLVGVSIPRFAVGLENPAEVLNTDVGIFTELGSKVDLNRVFSSSSGEQKALRDFVQPDKPVLIVPVYYKCPRLCGLVLDGVVQLLNELSLTLGSEYSVLAVGFDPTETPTDAAKVRATFMERLAPGVLSGSESFKFLVGDADQVTGVMKELGFRYKKDGADFAHSAAVMILTPGGEISQYFTGIQFPAWDVRLALIEASHGRIGSAIDHFLLFCFRFDPLQGKYLWAVEAVLRIGGALTLVGLGSVYWLFVFRRRRLRATADRRSP
jgi:protein SCO1/2